MFGCIKALYDNAKARVFCHGITSEEFNREVGVSLGDSFSSFIFFVPKRFGYGSFMKSKGVQGLPFIKNKLVQYNIVDNIDDIISLAVLMYADDTILLAESVEQLQITIDALKQYADTWEI